MNTHSVLDNLACMTDCFFEDFSISFASQTLQAILGKRSEKSGINETAIVDIPEADDRDVEDAILAARHTFDDGY